MNGLKVGVVWAGNPEHVNDHPPLGRSETCWRRCSPCPASTFVSLQVGPRAADLKKLERRQSRRSRILAPHFDDFADTAGAVSALDLVITVDTSVAHLAGALGKPVWVLLPWVTDWRWMLGREDNPWYPTMRLFRQKRGDDVAGEEMADVIAPRGGGTRKRSRGRRRAADAVQGRRRAPRRAGGRDHRGRSRTRPDAGAPATASIAIAPGQALILAEQKRRHGFLADADELTRRAAQAEPDNAEAAHMLGIIAHQSGKDAEAIEHLRRAIAIKPDVALYHANLGEMCRLAGRTDEAIAAGRRAIALDPEQCRRALSNLGIALFDQGKFEEALGLYQRAIALDANFAQAHSNRGNALQRLKRFAEAEPSYRRAIELAAEFCRRLEQSRHLPARAQTLRRKPRPFTARRWRSRPNNPDTLDNLALGVKDLERLDEAAELLRRALVDREHTATRFICITARCCSTSTRPTKPPPRSNARMALNPNNHDNVNLMGRIAFDRGDLAESLAFYQRALALKPDLADAYNNMGNALKELGRLREAQEAYQEALRIDPDDRRRLYQSRRLQEIRTRRSAISPPWRRWRPRPKACRKTTACSSISASARLTPT